MQLALISCFGLLPIDSFMFLIKHILRNEKNNGSLFNCVFSFTCVGASFQTRPHFYAHTATPGHSVEATFQISILELFCIREGMLSDR